MDIDESLSLELSGGSLWTFSSENLAIIATKAPPGIGPECQAMRRS